MRIWILSDLHRDISRRPWMPRVVPDADVVVVAGDVGHGLADSVSWLATALRPFMPVIFVPGNHEFYGGSLSEERELGRRAADMQDIILLDDRTVTLGGCSFSGATLWTDYALYGEADRQRAMRAAGAVMNDHRRIVCKRVPAWRPFRPEEALELHRTSRRFLEDALLAQDPPVHRARPHIVVSHHAPSALSISKSYAGSGLNPAFASDLDAFVRDAQPALWIHGHMHACAAYDLGASRVVCNPLGYDGENNAFDPEFVVEIAC